MMTHLRLSHFPFLAFYFAIAALSGCASTAPLEHSDLSAIKSGEQTLLLFRIDASIEGKPHEPFSGSLVDDNIGMALGTFETGGTLQRIERVRFFSDETRARGWTYLTVPRGTLYLAFLPPRRTDLFSYLAMFEHAQLWRIDVPEQSKIVYAGTLVVDGDSGFLLFGGEYLANFRKMDVRDERADAKILVSEYGPDLGPMETAVMQRHDGPILFTTPES
jgi:hypothetical protein